MLPGGTGKINVTITYEYDDLNRITSATYSDLEYPATVGTSFTYQYDAAGNVEEYVSVIAGQTITTTYLYNEANELVSASRNNVVWVYEYDGNGALTSTQPESGLAAGSKKYAYNTAGYLTKVEGYTGSDWYTQAEMSYTGLGDRLSMTGSTEDGQSVSTTYALSNGTVLLANAPGKVTAYLYGNGAIGEQTDAWSYALIDGTGTPRQMVDESAAVTAIASYTPWGDVLNSGGTGVFTTGMMGGMLDATTGLIYVGNGQYFDPETGRFLTRGNQTENTNPYVPWKGDPTQALVSPLILLALLYTRRKHRTKFDTLLVVLVLLCAAGLSLSAYTPVQAEALPASSGGGAGAPSAPMGYASTAEAGTSSGGAAGNPGSAFESPNNDDCPKPFGPPPWTDIEDLRTSVDFLAGFLYQYIDDLMYGNFDETINSYMTFSENNTYPIFQAMKLAFLAMGIDLTISQTTNIVRENTPEYLNGKEWGRRASILTGVVDGIIGAFMLGSSFTGFGLGAGCTVVSGGVCALVAAPAVALEAVVAVGGIVYVGIAATHLSYISGNPISYSRVYEPTKKHNPTFGHGSEMDLDRNTAQQVLNSGIEDGKQIYGYKDGKVYVFQPDNAGTYHGYRLIKDSKTMVPNDVLRLWEDEGIISHHKYLKLTQGKYD